MGIQCEWCGGVAKTGDNTVYWELPDGTRAVEITRVP
jgi:YgiT-type zinc finger domain-containing protein